MSKVLANLNKEIKKIEGRSLKGLIRGGIIIRRDMETTPPKIPVDLGNLRASQFMVTSKGESPAIATEGNFKGKKISELTSQHAETKAEAAGVSKAVGEPNIIFGFTAPYAMPVHEMVGATFKRPGSGAKFLEASLKRNTKKILQVIREEARIPE